MTGRNEPKQTVVNLLIFQCAGHFLAFRTRDVKEIVHMAELIVPPGLPSFMEGFLNFENRAAAVVSLSRLFFSRDSVKDLYTPLIILNTSPFLTALSVDRVVEIAAVSRGVLVPVKEEEIFNKSIAAVFPLPRKFQPGKKNTGEAKEESVYLVSSNRLLMEEEKARINEFETIARERLEKTMTIETATGTMLTDNVNEQC